ncbi:MAG: hypothetical protein RMM58_14205 [Chloroflexota bacterium]|nr:Ig-like domain-containing protein [Dehalococcoidia bacterium]MDW8255025.1 hypothetical protein [Chloroflexota bacterium]
MKRLAATVVAVVVMLPLLAHRPVSAQEAEVPLPNGRFFTQTSGDASRRTGFAVVDDSRARFWSEFQRLGGAAVVGYPISRRFTYHGFETQAFQKLVFQWKPGENRVDYLNVFDLLGEAGKDDWLATTKQVPNRGRFDEQGKPWDQIVASRLALLDKNPAIKAAYNNVRGNPIEMNGLPTSEITDYPNVQVLRAQRVVFQYWKIDVPWARAQTVTVANGGDVAKEAGLFPAEALRPMTLLEATAPAGSSATPAPPSAAPAPAGPPAAAPAAPLMLTPGEALRVELVGQAARPRPGQQAGLSLRVTDSRGNPVPGAVILILVHYPLKSDDTTYATDGIFFSRNRTDQNGVVVAEYMIDPKVPSGLGITLEVSALYPPTGGRLTLPMVVG